jgi:hypothetical protein
LALLSIPVVSSFKINNGAATTVNPNVTLPNVCAGATSATHFYMASESANFTSATTWQAYASVPLFTLSSGGGTKTVYFKVKDGAGTESSVTSDTITLGGAGYSVLAWGNTTWGECSIPVPNRGFIALAGGGGFSLGLKSDGSIVAWGYNESGQCTVPSPNSGFVTLAGGSVTVWDSNPMVRSQRGGRTIMDNVISLFQTVLLCLLCRKVSIVWG